MHPKNAWCWIIVTDSGIIISLRFIQLKNAYSHINDNDDGVSKDTCFKFVQLLNDWAPIDFIDAGIVTFFIFLQ